MTADVVTYNQTTFPVTVIDLAEYSWWEVLFTFRTKQGWVGPGFAYLSGILLQTILVVIVICSMPFVRRRGYFQVYQYLAILDARHPISHLLIIHLSKCCRYICIYLQVFYWTHSLFLLFWILLILHGPIFWMFFLAPGLLFIMEKIRTMRYSHMNTTEVKLLPSKVNSILTYVNAKCESQNSFAGY